MPRFMYQVRDVKGAVQTGQMEASDESELRSKLQTRNLTLIRSVTAGMGPKKAQPLAVPFFQKSVSSKELQIFTRQFSTLINAGIPVVECLKILGEGKRNELLKESANKIKSSIESGKKLSDALAQHPIVFDKFYVNMVNAGEEAGILDGILMRLSTYLEKSEKMKKQVKGAMFYPGVVMAVALLVVVGILVFVMPKFQEMFASSGKELPALTKGVLALSHFLMDRWYVFIAGLIVIPWLFLNWIKTEEGKATFDSIMIRSPIFGELIQKSSVAKMTRTLSTLLSSGVGVIEALDIASRTAGNKVIENALRRCKESVTAGKPLAAPLAKEKMIPDMVTQMISIGEQSGTMDIMLGKIADFYEDDVENVVKTITSLIEPLLMVFLGGAIAILVMAMYLPIFDMANINTGG